MNIRKLPPSKLIPAWSVSIGSKAVKADSEAEADRIIEALQEAFRLGQEHKAKQVRDVIGAVDCACLDQE